MAVNNKWEPFHSQSETSPPGIDASAALYLFPDGDASVVYQQSVHLQIMLSLLLRRNHSPH